MKNCCKKFIKNIKFVLIEPLLSLEFFINPCFVVEGFLWERFIVWSFREITKGEKGLSVPPSL